MNVALKFEVGSQANIESEGNKNNKEDFRSAA
jgi:hypothetical protein